MRRPNLDNFIERIRCARLPRVLGLYIVVSWALLEAIDLMTSRFGLPGWFFPVGLVLLVIGLPIVTITAFIQGRLAEGEREAQGSGASAASEYEGEEAELEGIQRLFTWRLAILGGVLAFLTLGTIGASVVWFRVQGEDLRPEAVAVMPFHIVGSEAELWREGLIDLMSTALDATGRFHSSDPRAVLNRWRRMVEAPDELAEPGVATQVASSLGAGRVILGSLIQIGPGMVRLSADLYSVKWRRREASAVVEGREEEMTALVDRLTVDLLRSIWSGDISEVRVSALVTASIPALRAYLEGEQAFRRSQFNEAQAAFHRAIEHDSTFAIAYYRLAQTYGWFLGLGSGEVSKHLTAAERHSDGLPARDSLLIRGWKLADVDGSPAAIPLFQNLVTRYPDDLEAWHGLGDALFHMGGRVGRPMTSAIEPLERTLALDSTFAPALIHLIESAYVLGDTVRGRKWTEQYLALDTTSMYAQSFRLLSPLNFGPPADSARAAAALDTANADLLSWALARMRGAGPLPVYQMVALKGADPRFSDMERHMPLWYLGIRYLRHGQVGLALELIQQSMAFAGGLMDPQSLNIVATLRELGLAVDSSSAAMAARLADRQGRVPPGMAVEAARQGRLSRAYTVVDHLENRADSLLARGDSVYARSIRGQAWALRGRIAAAQDSIDAAIRHLRRGLDMINATWHWEGDLNRFWLANLIQDRGGEEEALRIFGSLYATPWTEAPGYYHRAQLHERRGEFDAAASYYARFIELWANADEHLQPRVEAARQAIERLRGQRIAS